MTAKKPETKSNKPRLFAATAVTCATLVFGAPAIAMEAVMCTMDAKQCPDGSFVSRTGPNCEFAPCPGEQGGVTGEIPPAHPGPGETVEGSPPESPPVSYPPVTE